MLLTVITLSIALCAAALISHRYWSSLKAAQEDLKRYAAIRDIESEVHALEKHMAGRKAELQTVQHECVVLREQSRELKKAIALHSEEAEFLSFGVYTPKYDFQTAGDYEARLEAIKAKQKQLVKAGKAAVCPTEWKIEGSRAKGKKATEQLLKLMLRAFNGEGDALVGRVSYKNVESFAERTRKAFETLNTASAEESAGRARAPKRCSPTRARSADRGAAAVPG